MESVYITRARQLIQQHRWELAEKDLRLALAEDPNDAYALSLLALCLNKREQYAESRQIAKQAVLLDPESPFMHYVLAATLHDQNHFAEAEVAIREALRLNPRDAQVYALLGQIAFAQRKWQETLDAANEGLAIDAENDNCVNLRALALVKLGNKHDAHDVIRSALERDPENANTHANLGWTLLEKGEPQKAMEHFREALRINPESEWARHGIVEAMKARFIIYGWLLRFFLWTSRLNSRAQFGLMIGGYIGYRFLDRLADQNPNLSPWIRPICIAYLIFVVMTWIGTALFNLVLRLNRFGRLALSREETVTSNWVGGMLLVGLLFVADCFLFGHWLSLMPALMFGFMTFPLSRIYNCDKGWPRTTLILCAAAMACIAMASTSLLMLAVYATDGDLQSIVGGFGVLLFYGFCLTIFVLQFVIPILMSAVVRK